MYNIFHVILMLHNVLHARKMLHSGRCPTGLTIDTFEERGFSEQNRPPSVSPLFVTVPG
jgi:hypothetical protein